MKHLTALVFCAVLAFAAPCATGSAQGEIPARQPGADVPATAGEAAESPGFIEAEAGYAGTWVPFEDGFELYLPSGWRSFEITDAQSRAGLFYRAGSGVGDDAADIPMGVAVGFSKAAGLDSPEALVLELERAGAVDVREVSLNGIPAVCFARPEDGFRGVMFFHPEYSDYVLSVYVTPAGEEGTAAFDVGSAILASVTPWQLGVGE